MRSSEGNQEESVTHLRGTLISVAFWTCLFVAVGLYGFVVLSPKFVRHAERHQQFQRTQQQLVDLQNQVDYWRKLTCELESNQDFRLSFQSTVGVGTSETTKIIPVESSLRYQGIRTGSEQMPKVKSPVLRMCEKVTGSRILRIAGLATSAGLLLFAFTSLVETRCPIRLPNLRRFRPTIDRQLVGIGRRYVLTMTPIERSHARRRKRFTTDV
ncbi:MAG: hypothetical protein KDA93_14730 [Planctomycetaceae bacterium]|nr:hypothetical protein [Planctomycetaceae bacterium]